ncbi:tail assembly chaperone E/41/14-like protein [Azospirillum baldaniorum]|uniref:phage tail assembly protein n=1 Tax=Azospirillum baldaniorum TaxID=1064539 RepID=UPI00119EC8CA|nr:phage tail assembly protein [Azospirillum baldaniorum]TWA69735.1 tail assembly chaperone E/41/14-like protein [Azospirillum baldaniorum]
MSDNTVTLKKPIKAHGEEVSALTFREPNGDDIMTCGYPLQMSGDGSFTPLANVCGKYISRLGNIPASSVKALTAPDFQACMMTIIPFFTDGLADQAPANED